MKKLIVRIVSVFLMAIVFGVNVVNALEFSEIYIAEWTKTTDLEISYNSLVAVTDGYVVVGETHVKALIAKYNLNGGIVWWHEEPGNMYSNYSSIASTNNGFIAVGTSSSSSSVWGNNGNMDAIIVKYNSAGIIEWAHNIGGSAEDKFTSVAVVNDGYIAVGYSTSADSIWGNNGYYDAIIVKFDLDGTVAWSRNIGGSAEDKFTSVAVVNDGYVVVGNSYSSDALWGNNGVNDAIIVKYDLDGNTLWYNNIGGSGNDFYESVIAIADGYITVGYSNDTSLHWGNNGGEDAIIAKHNLNGTLAWAHNTGGYDMDSFSSVAVDDWGYIAVGLSWTKPNLFGSTGADDTDAIIVRYDFDGFVLTSYNYGDEDNESFRDIVTTGDSLIVVGETFHGWKNPNPRGLIAKYTLKDSIVKNAENPQTGIPSIYIVLTVASIGIISFIILSKKKNHFAKI